MKLDIGCGKNKKEGFVGVDILELPGVDKVIDLREPWPFEDNSVDEVNCSHFIEHLTNLNDKWERVRFFNELYRVMKSGAQALLIFPHWNSHRYYGDPTHKEPFSEMGFFYLDKAWRDVQAPHTDSANSPSMYSCDFNWTYGYSLHPQLLTRNTEYQQYALTFLKEAAQDIIATLTKK
jgi:ubiquinone/menaquinone biosynthesis C-methylase UbiE